MDYKPEDIETQLDLSEEDKGELEAAIADARRKEEEDDEEKLYKSSQGQGELYKGKY